MRTSLALAISRIKDDAKIRICWPNPDMVCLQSGCGHCADSLTVIRVLVVSEYAEANEMSEDFAYGLQHNWGVRLIENGLTS